MSNSKWIWHPGSFELYHGMLLHNRRTTTRTYQNGQTKSVYYYPMWRVDAPVHNAILQKTATLEKEETIEFFANTDASAIVVDHVAYNRGAKITLSKGEHTIVLQGYKTEGFPAFYVKGEVFATDRSWVVAEGDKAGRHAGYSDLYTSAEDNVEVFKFSYKKMRPVSKEKVDGGIIYDFGKEVFGKITISNIPKSRGEFFASLGESYEEAIDVKYATIGLNVIQKNGKFKSDAVALRYIFIPEATDEYSVTLDFEYLPLENKGSFKCDNEFVNKLWDVCAIQCF